ncbi:MAG: ABC transporter ATP-binding protein [Myxococcales bacterium]|nr:ABC transporter ATP-binding protein [Myxococcales bacterium]MCB9668426.1 ABC transporter ATP-binding protein [Alphaproteobacteria bacterium]MCB9690664.1 ABC transporter ATP-binding protein [Alphaproteobacteria bacterium]
MIRLVGIDKTYRVGAHPLHVLKGLHLTVPPGELLAIMGSSGSGKSTLLNILGILDGYDGGEYWLGDALVKDLSERKAADYRNRFLGFVFQSFHLLPFKTALENVALPLYYQGVSRKERLRRAAEHLDQVGLSDWSGHLPGELSGGQKQRVAIARALVTRPRVMLADEPTGALDSVTTQEIMDLLKRVNAEGMTIVVVTHESDIAEQCARTVFLKDGRFEGER